MGLFFVRSLLSKVRGTALRLGITLIFMIASREFAAIIGALGTRKVSARLAKASFNGRHLLHGDQFSGVF